MKLEMANMRETKLMEFVRKLFGSRLNFRSLRIAYGKADFVSVITKLKLFGTVISLLCCGVVQAQVTATGGTATKVVMIPLDDDLLIPIIVRGTAGSSAVPAAGTVTPLPAPASITRTMSYIHDAATGLLTQMFIEPDGGSKRLEIDILLPWYDAYGNALSTSTIGDFGSHSASMKFDGRGRFPQTITNPLGQTETRAYDGRFGSLTSLQDPNLLTTSIAYDGFGRKILEVRPDGTRTKWEYFYCSGFNGGTTPCPTTARYMVQVTPQSASSNVNGPWTRVFYDGFDRVVESNTLGFDGGSIAKKTIAYDRFGNVSQVSRPYYAGQTGTLTTYDYDILARPTQATRAGVVRAKIDYNGPTTTFYNALGKTRTEVRDALGRRISVRDESDEQAIFNYEYDSFGNLTRTIDANGNVTGIAYDVRGFKTRMIDPDLGDIQYVNNALGEVVQRTDAKKQVATFEYDGLGRMKTRTEQDMKSSWTYDSCYMGIGKLCSAQTDAGFRKERTYDALGRLSTTKSVIDAAYLSSFTYDGDGRLATQTYPSGVSIKYEYVGGYLSAVRDNRNNQLYWQKNAAGAGGELVQQTYGNGVVNNREYFPDTGLLKHTYAGLGGGSAISDQTYDYYLTGDLSNRADIRLGLTESFWYDSRQRLTTSSINYGGTLAEQKYDYDGIGNIKLRSDVGVYTPRGTNARPHGLAYITLNSGNKRYYGYDDNGNLVLEEEGDASNREILSKTRKIDYTSFDMPVKISSNGTSIAYNYGPDHERVKSVEPSATTIYVHPDNEGGLMYERSTMASGGVVDKNFITVDGEVIALVKREGSSETVSYLHYDNLGSVTVVTDAAGNAIDRLAYEAFGKRRNLNGAIDSANALTGTVTDRGFTDAQHLDQLGLIHMNGRVYDPAIGRFLSADPTVPDPGNMQSFNRYAYVLNNPVSLIDPSGYSPIYTTLTDITDTSTPTTTWGGFSFTFNTSSSYFPMFSSAGTGLPKSIAGPQPIEASKGLAGSRLPMSANNWYEDSAIHKWASDFDKRYANEEKLIAFLSPESFKEAADFYAAQQHENGNLLYGYLSSGMSFLSDHYEVAGMVLSMGRSGRQLRLRELSVDDKLGTADRGWIKQEINSIERGQRTSVRNPPGRELAHERGREAAKGYDYSHSNLQDRDLHRTQHKYDDFGRANKERPLDK